MSNNREIFSKNVTETRPFDFIYDTVYTVPTKNDYYKLVAEALERTGEKVIRPLYSSMFSDVMRYPKSEYICKTEKIPLTWEEKSRFVKTKRFEKVSGRNQLIFVFKPEVDLSSKSYTEQFNQAVTSKICINNIHGSITTKKELKQSIVQKATRNKGTQTDYRDSDTQTDPWLPPCIITNNSDLSKILFLKSEKGAENELLPIYDINAIEEKLKIHELREKLLSTDKRNFHTQIAIIKQIEQIDWITKQKRMDHLKDIRMELAHKTLYRYTTETKICVSKRIEYQKRRQDEIKNQKLESVQRQKEREIRKLEEKRRHKLGITVIENLTF